MSVEICGVRLAGMCARHSSVCFLRIMQQNFLLLQKMLIVGRDVVSHIIIAESWEQPEDHKFT